MNNHMSTVEFFAENSDIFLIQVYLPIGIWLLIVLAFFIMLLKKYTFGDWSEENPNPYFGETFDMPRGIFRGTLTLTLLFVVVILELVNVRITGFEEEMHELMIAFQMMLAFYFGSKVMHHMTSTDRRKTEFMTSSPYYSHMGINDEFDDDGAAG
ncbi:MAG: hypothetical protein ABFS35_04445 [Bacteroidota bacterium]